MPDNETLRALSFDTSKQIKHAANCSVIIFSRKVYQCPCRGTSMVDTIKLDKTEKVGITLPSSILKRMDNVRGDIPRSAFIRRAIEQFLRKEGK